MTKYIVDTMAQLTKKLERAEMRKKRLMQLVNNTVPGMCRGCGGNGCAICDMACFMGSLPVEDLRYWNLKGLGGSVLDKLL